MLVHIIIGDISVFENTLEALSTLWYFHTWIGSIYTYDPCN